MAKSLVVACSLLVLCFYTSSCERDELLPPVVITSIIEVRGPYITKFVKAKLVYEGNLTGFTHGFVYSTNHGNPVIENSEVLDLGPIADKNFIFF